MSRKSLKALGSVKMPLAGRDGPNPGTLSAECNTNLSAVGIIIWSGI